MINKIVESLAAALADVQDGARLMVGGFGGAGIPEELLLGLLDKGVRELTLITNNGSGLPDKALSRLLQEGRVSKLVCTYPRSPDSKIFDELYRAGKIELELVPQGTLAERIRAAGSGIGGFFTPTAYGTPLAEGKETRLINGRHYVLELPLHSDFALIRGFKADRWGNLVYRKAARNFAPIMAMAAKTTIVQVHEVVDLGALDPEHIITPGIFVQRVVQVPQALPARASEPRLQA